MGERQDCQANYCWESAGKYNCQLECEEVGMGKEGVNHTY